MILLDQILPAYGFESSVKLTFHLLDLQKRTFLSLLEINQKSITKQIAFCEVTYSLP